jgi:riboflavin synthase
MFTGIIEGRGTVKSVEKKGTSGRISIEAPFSLSGAKPGDSIAVDGVCLTITSIEGITKGFGGEGHSVRGGGGVFTSDLSVETLGTTTLGRRSAGDYVNIERPLKLSDPLGGHLVTGHIDAVGSVLNRVSRGGFIDFEFAVPRELSAHLVKKGSVAVDGISLTIAGLTADGFRVAVIPHTLKLTTLGSKTPGDHVNIETDIIAKYVERLLAGARGQGGAGVTEDLLSEHGFLGKQ